MYLLYVTDSRDKMTLCSQASTLNWFDLRPLNWLVFLSEHLYIAFLHGYSFPVRWSIKKLLNCVLTFFVNRDLLFLWYSSLVFLDIPEIFEPVWKWFFWWTELWIFCVALQSVNCCCVQCDCCGFYGGDNKYIGCVLCTCGFLSSIDYTMMIFCLCTFGYFWLDTQWLVAHRHTHIHTHTDVHL